MEQNVLQRKNILIYDLKVISGFIWRHRRIIAFFMIIWWSMEPTVFKTPGQASDWPVSKTVNKYFRFHVVSPDSFTTPGGWYRAETFARFLVGIAIVIILEILGLWKLIIGIFRGKKITD